MCEVIGEINCRINLPPMFLCRFHYDYFKKKYPQAMLLFTDTDSLMYWVQTADLYKELFADRERFDFASFEKSSPYYDGSNNKVIGKMKDEANGKPITEFVGLRPKMYSFLFEENGQEKERHRAKGINKAASRNLRHEQFKAQLSTPVENFLPNHRIANAMHDLYTLEVGVSNRYTCTYYVICIAPRGGGYSTQFTYNKHSIYK